MAIGIRILWPTHTDIWQHLATEEWLLSQLGPQDAVLYLWQSAGAVVIGKHQNPWRECQPERLAAAGGRLARRVSGGGAVYHDLGNLNYSFLLPRAAYDRDRLSELVLAALRRLALPVEHGPRSVLRADGRKFSGNAFCLRREGALHHGTLLIHADLARLEDWLQPACPLLETKAIASVRATVVNLAELSPGLSPAVVGDALIAEFRATWPAAVADIITDLATYSPAAPDAIAALAARHPTWDWCCGETPAFRLPLPEPAGAVLEVVAGRVAAVHGAPSLDAVWRGTIFQPSALLATLGAQHHHHTWPGLAQWLRAPHW